MPTPEHQEENVRCGERQDNGGAQAWPETEVWLNLMESESCFCKTHALMAALVAEVLEASPTGLGNQGLAGVWK